MKTKAISLIIALTLCTAAIYAQKTQGNEKLTTKEIQVSEFSSIEIGSGIECNGSRIFGKNKFHDPVFYYKQIDGKSSIQITTDENLFSLLDITSNNGKLVIGTKNKARISPSKFEVNGASKNLEKVMVSGCVDFKFKSSLKSKVLDISISGASDVKMEEKVNIDRFKISISGAGDLFANKLTCDEIETHVSGAGDIELEGSANKAKFSVSGAGDIKAYNFIVKHLDCTVSGSGDLKVMATETINAKASGTGDIHYKGNATATTKSSGFGDIKKVN